MDSNKKDSQISEKTLFGPSAEKQEFILRYYQNRGLFKYDRPDDQYNKIRQDAPSEASDNK